MRARPHHRHGDTTEPPTPVELVRAATREYGRAKRSRDAAIAQARAAGTASIRELADAADLSPSRIKQIAGGPVVGGACLPAVPEMDLRIDRASEDDDGDDHDRVFALATVDPWLKSWPSEREFLGADSARLEGNRSDFVFELYDLDPTIRWTLVYAAGTNEVYVFADQTPADNAPEIDSADGEGRSPDPAEGSPTGPCIVLGRAFSYEFLDAGLGYSIHNVIRRPGGLAWVYGRLRLLNGLLATTSRGRAGITAEPTAVWAYLEMLSPRERKV